MDQHYVPSQNNQAPLPSFLDDWAFFGTEAEPVGPATVPAQATHKEYTPCYSPSPTSPNQDISRGVTPSSDHMLLEMENVEFGTIEALLDQEQLALATATMASEATGSHTHLVKEELRFRIQKKRLNSGRGPLKTEYKQDGPEQVSVVKK